MSEPFVGEVRPLAFNFAPRGWAFCDGQLLAVSQNDALFSLVGTIYGGDGTTTFGLPDLRGRIPVHSGTGPGLSTRKLGQKTGSERETITTSTMPYHNHNITGSINTTGLTDSPVGAVPAAGPIAFYSTSLNKTREMVPGMIDNSGGSQSHTNIMPFQCIHYCIALVGIYPSRH